MILVHILRTYPKTAGDWLILRRLRSKMCLSPSLQRPCSISRATKEFEYLDLDWSEMRARYFALGIEARRVPIIDFNDDHLRDNLPVAVQALSELADEKHDILVHCNAGVNRSPSVVIAWLAWQQGWTLEESEQHVIKCHRCAPVMEVVRSATQDRRRTTF